MKWVTRERVHVDRVACPWLIRKFVDPKAEFLFVPADQVMAVAGREGATPFDAKGVELGHHGKECSFDAIIKNAASYVQALCADCPPEVERQSHVILKELAKLATEPEATASA